MGDLKEFSPPVCFEVPLALARGGLATRGMEMTEGDQSRDAQDFVDLRYGDKSQKGTGSPFEGRECRDCEE